MKAFLFLTGILSALIINGQLYSEGGNYGSIGFGLPPGGQITANYNQYENFTDYRLKNYGTIVAKYENGLSDYFGLGVNFEYTGASVSFKYDDNNSLGYQKIIKINTFGGFVRMNGHFPIGDIFDIYGGVGLGYLYHIENTFDSNPANTESDHKYKNLNFTHQVTAGIRYKIKDNMALFFEFGKATTASKLGMTMVF